MTGLLEHHFGHNSPCFCGGPQADGPGVVLGCAEDMKLTTPRDIAGMRWWSCLIRYSSTAKLAELERGPGQPPGGI